jgi:hypothetical protein
MKEYKQLINELFDETYEYNKISSIDPDIQIYRFDTLNDIIEVSFAEGFDGVERRFTSKKFPGQNYTGVYDIRIFSTIMKITAEYIKKMRPERLYILSNNAKKLSIQYKLFKTMLHKYNITGVVNKYPESLEIEFN